MLAQTSQFIGSKDPLVDQTIFSVGEVVRQRHLIVGAENVRGLKDPVEDEALGLDQGR